MRDSTTSPSGQVSPDITIDLCLNPYGCNYQVCQIGSLLETTYYWTPVVVVNSPFDGSATGTSQVSVSTGWTVQFDESNTITSSSGSSTSDSTSASNGASNGIFQDDAWSAYSTYNQNFHAAFGQFYVPDPCTAPHVLEITWQGGKISYGLQSSSWNTLAIPKCFNATNPSTHATEQSLCGLSTMFGYSTNNDNFFSSCNNGGPYVDSVTDSTMASTSIGITVTGGYGPISVSAGFSMFASTTSTASFTYSYPGGNVGTWFLDTLNGQSGGLLAYEFLPCGAPGCVSEGTPILTPHGYVAVQKLRTGDNVMEFNTTNGQLSTGVLVSTSISKTNATLSINHGALSVTLTDQPIFVRTSTWAGWLKDPQNLTLGDQIFDPVTGTWVTVTNLTVIVGTVKVFDVVTSNLNDFIANGFLLDRKP